MSSPLRIAPSLILTPGGLGISQLPAAAAATTLLNAQSLQERKLEATDFPVAITAPVLGDIPVFDGTEFVNQRWIPVAFGFGAPPVANQLLTLSPGSSQWGLVIPLASGAVSPALEVRTAAGLPVLSVSPTGALGVGLAPSHTFHVVDGPLETWFDRTHANLAGAMGWVLNKQSATNLPHAINWYVDGTYRWGMGQDFDTVSSSGDADFILVNDAHTLFNGGGGSDVLRFSPGNASAQGLKAVLGAPCGSPRAFGQFFTILGSPNLAPLGMQVNTDNAGVNAINLTRGAAGTNCLRINWNNVWITGLDISFAGGSDLAWFCASGGTRMVLKGNAALTAALGVGTGNPQGIIAAASSNDPSLYDQPQIYFTGSYQDTPNTHAINLQTILNASAVKNYVMLNGMASGTVASPTLTSLTSPSFGLESTDTALALITAALGTGVAPIRGLSMDSAGNITLAAAFTAPGTSALGTVSANSLTLTGAFISPGSNTLGTVTANSLTVTGTLTAGALSAGSLALTGTLAVTGTVTVSGGLLLPQVTKSAGYTLTSSDFCLFADASSGAVTITLPTAVGNAGRQFIVKKKDATTNGVTLATTAAQTIDGSSTALLTVPNQSLTALSDGANWLVV